MADFQFNIAKGRIVELFRRVDIGDPATSGIIVVLLQAAEDDDVLVDYDDLDTLLTAAGNTESTFTNYVRGVWVAADITLAAPNDTSNWRVVDVPDIVIANAGLTDSPMETIVKVLMCYAPDTAGADSTFEPLLAYGSTLTLDGTTLTITPASGTIAFRSQ